MLWGREPVLYLTLVEVALALAVGFGLGLTDHQVALIVAVVAAVLGVVTRHQVTPVRRAQTQVDQAYKAGQESLGRQANQAGSQ